MWLFHKQPSSIMIIVQLDICSQRKQHNSHRYITYLICSYKHKYIRFDILTTYTYTSDGCPQKFRSNTLPVQSHYLKERLFCKSYISITLRLNKRSQNHNKNKRVLISSESCEGFPLSSQEWISLKQ